MGNISVTNPIGLAIERVRLLLFRPFDLGKWFIIGFCAWLAGLGERGFSGNFHSSSNSGSQKGDIHQQLEKMHFELMQNLYWILPLAIFVFIVVLALWIVFIWLNSRGKFMFLYCVALNRAEVRKPWNRYAAAAGSLFWFRIVLWLISMAVTLPLLVLIGVSAFSMFVHNSWNPAGILVMVVIAMFMILIGIFFALVRKLTVDFVAPIMFLRGSRCLNAWREFLQLLGANAGEFVLYLLFQIVLAIAIGVIVVAVVLVTCCIAGCVMAIPYVGTVLLLPLITFKRAYSLYYFAQFGPAYNAFAPSA